MDFSTPYRIHQLSHVVYCTNDFLSTNSLIGVSSLPRFKKETRLADLFVVSSIFGFSSSSSMAKLALQFASEILDTPLVVLCDLGFHLSPKLRAPHSSLPYIRHCFHQILLCRRRIKLRGNPFQKLFLILNIE
jgi:hypothetical protein